MFFVDLLKVIDRCQISLLELEKIIQVMYWLD